MIATMNTSYLQPRGQTRHAKSSTSTILSVHTCIELESFMILIHIYHDFVSIDELIEFPYDEAHFMLSEEL